MIKKKSLALVIDTNILSDIITKTQDSPNIMNILRQWLENVLNDLTRQIKGKDITIFISDTVIKDYKSGLCQRNHKNQAKMLKDVFEKYLSQKISIPKQTKIFLSLRKTSTKNTDKAKHTTDKGDERFVSLLDAIQTTDKWRDRSIIFASGDRLSLPEIEKHFTISPDAERFRFASNLSEFEEIIKC